MKTAHDYFAFGANNKKVGNYLEAIVHFNNALKKNQF